MSQIGLETLYSNPKAFGNRDDRVIKSKDMSTSATRVLIYSPFALHRAAWLALLSGQPGIEAIGSAGCLEELVPFKSLSGQLTLLAEAETVPPDFVHETQRILPGCGVLFLVQDDRLEAVIALLKTGATGFVLRNQSTGDLSKAIIAVGRGELVLPESIAVQSLLFLSENQAVEGLLEPLTPREQEVLGLLAEGQNNKDIAQSLFLSVRTVEAHLRTIFGKIGVRSRTEAALWAVRQGYAKGS